MPATDASPRQHTTPFTVYLAAAFLVFIAGAYVNDLIPRTLVTLYLVMSLLCYAAYALDKKAARNSRRRIPERNLHLLALFGGWPGARVAQHRFRHKTQKQAFRRLFCVTVTLNIAGLAWLMTPEGSAVLADISATVYQALPDQ
jgi:uncharacterized membrane protein YsdA (DUF1294 family)